ncbi:helix-turn-helix domain-containing protein [Acetonema longum]|uniref:Resolvase HTH domain-containing protein n=1 Tax=Acetonema longum DSM 6540 TaxID=1009370 RepID=F7NPJ8_9FIRM|nr:helix-turn-helix domain-containing protein [Acetonema longum]EGO62038.1 hypothetical protein ALO_20217 [Acetonema longum DSM 6540]
MPQKYTNIKSLEHIIMQMREEGRTRKEIADVLGIKKVQIKNWIMVLRLPIEVIH